MSEIALQIEILWPALIAGLLVLATHVPMGREVLSRGIIFLDLAIAQTAAFGVVLANTLLLGDHSGHDHAHSHLPPEIIAILAAVIGSLGLYALRGLEVRVQESCIGILFVLMATGIVLLLSADPHGGERLKEIMVGQILWLQPKDLWQLLLATVVILMVWQFGQQRLGTWIFYPLFAITVTLSTQVVGVYLVFASLIIPALATMKGSYGHVKAYLIGALGYGIGLFVSALFDLPAGATIVWMLTSVAALYVLVTKLHKRLPNGLCRQRSISAEM